MSEVRSIPVLAILVESDGAVEGDWTTASAGIEWKPVLWGLIRELAGAGQTEASYEEADFVVAAYRREGTAGHLAESELSCTRLSLRQGSIDGLEGSGQEVACVLFPSLEASLTALGKWVLEREQIDWPVLVVHMTQGRIECSPEEERKAGTVKVACDLRRAPSVFYNILVTADAVSAFPRCEEVAENAPPLVKTLYRMSSPIGIRGVELLARVGSVGESNARYFEAVRSVEDSVVTRFAGVLFADAIKQRGVALNECLTVRAFLMPKERETLDDCEDVVSIHQNRRRFAISDGAGTASYSAEWARALCRQAMDTPPPVFADVEGATTEGRTKEDEDRLRGWWGNALDYWRPEVPWERLVSRLTMVNKAKEGSGATLAGIEILDGGGQEGVRFRAWALGDTCVIHLRNNKVLASRPMVRADQFNNVPLLLLTRPGFVEIYLRHWQSWESTLVPGDILLMGTDALSKYILGALESGAGTGVLAWLRDLLCKSQVQGWHQFEEFVDARRYEEQMKNDDVAIVLIEMKKDEG